MRRGNLQRRNIGEGMRVRVYVSVWWRGNDGISVDKMEGGGVIGVEGKG